MFIDNIIADYQNFTTLQAELLVYECSDRVGITALRIEAETRILQILKDDMPCKYIAAAYDLILLTTSVTSGNLRRNCLDLCVEARASYALSQNLCDVIEVHEPLCASILETAIQAIFNEEQHTEIARERASENLAEKNSYLKSISSLQAQIDIYENCQRKLTSTLYGKLPHCQYCGHEQKFDTVTETIKGHDLKVLRRKCNYCGESEPLHETRY